MGIFYVRLLKCQVQPDSLVCVITIASDLGETSYDKPLVLAVSTGRTTVDVQWTGFQAVQKFIVPFRGSRPLELDIQPRLVQAESFVAAFIGQCLVVGHTTTIDHAFEGDITRSFTNGLVLQECTHTSDSIAAHSMYSTI